MYIYHSAFFVCVSHRHVHDYLFFGGGGIPHPPLTTYPWKKRYNKKDNKNGVQVIVFLEQQERQQQRGPSRRHHGNDGSCQSVGLAR